MRVAGGLLADVFTLGQAQRLYEALRGEPVDPANFRRDVKATGLLARHGRAALGGHGPARQALPADGGRLGAYPSGRPP